jgi:precorrin-3B C17-methyltransferase
MSGWLAIAGIGPGAAQLITAEVTEALAEATDLIGYAAYVARVPARADLVRHASDNREELDRARLGLRLAAQGKRVVVVSSGDPGVFAMAAAVFEAVEAGDPSWRDLDIRVLPGISAMFAAAARIGAPLGHDFCAINLSDNLKPWDLVERRLRLAAQADFVIALYNPLSSARPWQLGRALELLREELPGSVPVVFASAVSDIREAIDTVTLRDAVASRADMRTLVLIGSSQTRLIARVWGCGLRHRASASSWSRQAIPACSRWRRRCSKRSRSAIPHGAISISECCPASARCSPPLRGSAPRSGMISAPSICRTI